MTALKILTFWRMFGDSDNEEELEGFGIKDKNPSIKILREMDFYQSQKNKILNLKLVVNEGIYSSSICIIY